VGLTAAAVAAAGTYFLYGSKNAAQNREAVKSWALKAKADVLEQLESAKKMTKTEYEQLVHSVAEGYAGLKGTSKKDIQGFIQEMMDHWHKLERNHAPQKAAKKATKKAAKVAKKASKTAKKATKTAKKAAS